MENFKVKKEYKNKRCGICHQKDLFDPDVAECYRCKNLINLGTPNLTAIIHCESMFLMYQTNFLTDTTILKNRLVIIVIIFLVITVLYFCQSLLILIGFMTNPITYICCLLYITESLGDKLLLLNLNPVPKFSSNISSKYDSINEFSPYWKLDFEKDI